MTSWLRYVLLGIELAQFSRCQTDDDDDEDDYEDEDEDENEPEEDEDDDISSVLPPAATSVPPPASEPATSSLPPAASSTPLTSIPPTTTGTTSTAISTFATSETPTVQAETEPTSNDVLPSPSPTPTSSGGLSTGAKAGIGVGVVLFVLLFLGILLFEWRRRRTRGTKTESKRRDQDSTQLDSRSSRNGLNRNRRTTINDHYATDSEAKPKSSFTPQGVYAHYSEKDAGHMPPGVTKSETERPELSAEVPTYELEGEMENRNSPGSPRSPPGRTILSAVSPLSNIGTNQ